MILLYCIIHIFPIQSEGESAGLSFVRHRLRHGVLTRRVFDTDGAAAAAGNKKKGDTAGFSDSILDRLPLFLIFYTYSEVLLELALYSQCKNDPESSRIYSK